MRNADLRTVVPGIFAVVACAMAACGTDASRTEAAAPVVEASAAMVDPLAKDVREQFENKYSCPANRVDVKRLDQAPGSRSPAMPPDEVKNDPGRYAKWQADQENTVADHEVFEIIGCGHTSRWDCRPHHAHGAVYPEMADCDDVKPTR